MPDEYKCKNPQQNSANRIQQYVKDDTLPSSGVNPRDERMT
jgi:hypothetical protein